MRLSGLIEGAGARLVRGDPDVRIRGLTADSRRCGPGHLFAALPGGRTDGRRFIGDALGRGGVAVLVEDDGSPAPRAGGATVLAASPARRSFAIMCARFHGPGPRIAVAVTGTNGKSSVADFGAATKGQMQQTIAAILGLPETPPSDAADALSVGLCHIMRSQSDSALSREIPPGRER